MLVRQGWHVFLFVYLLYLRFRKWKNLLKSLAFSVRLGRIKLKFSWKQSKICLSLWNQQIIVFSCCEKGITMFWKKSYQLPNSQMLSQLFSPLMSKKRLRARTLFASNWPIFGASWSKLCSEYDKTHLPPPSLLLFHWCQFRAKRDFAEKSLALLLEVCGERSVQVEIISKRKENT